jgi:hypothetical protein
VGRRKRERERTTRLAKRVTFQFQNAARGVVDALKLAKLGPLPDFIVASAERPHGH